MPSKSATLYQYQQLELNVLAYFEEKKQHCGPIITIILLQERVAAALIISVGTLLWIKCRNNANPGKSLYNPGKKMPHNSRNGFT